MLARAEVESANPTRSMPCVCVCMCVVAVVYHELSYSVDVVTAQKFNTKRENARKR